MKKTEKTSRPLHAILASRMARELNKMGISITHSQAIIATAAALGYHNAHELASASKHERLATALAQPLDEDKTGQPLPLILLQDPKTDRWFGVEPVMKKIPDLVVSPDGNLIKTTPASGQKKQEAIAILCPNATASSETVIEILETEPGYPRAITTADYADIFPFLENSEWPEVKSLSEDEKTEISMKIMDQNREDFREEMVRGIEKYAEKIMEKMSKEDVLNLLAP